MTRPTPLLEVNALKKHFPIKGGVLGGTTGHVYAVDGVSFESFCTAIQMHDHRQNKNFLARKTTTNNQKTTYAPRTNKTPASAGSDPKLGGAKPQTTTPTSTTNRLPVEEMKDLLARGACFHCKKTGHRSRECPKRLTEKRASDARIAAIMARMGYDEKMTDDLSAAETGSTTSTGKVLEVLSEDEGN